MILAPSFTLFLVSSTYMGWLPTTLTWVYLLLSVVTFAAYGLDKAAARNGNWRMRESSLLLFGLFGGWPGAILAQRLFRHKTRKNAYQVAFWVTVALNATVTLVLASGWGNQLRALLH